MGIKRIVFKDIESVELRDLSKRLTTSLHDSKVRSELPVFLLNYIGNDANNISQRICRCVRLIDQEVLVRFYSGIIN